MTIASQTSRIAYTGDSSTTAFAVPFYFAANADLVVILQDTLGNQTTQVLGTNYTLTGATLAAGGTCTFTTAPTTGYLVTIYRDPPVTQTTSYNNNDPFPAKSHETALDKLTTIAQRLKDLYSRTIRQSDGEASMTTTLASVATRKNKILGFDGTGALVYTTGPTFVGTTATGVAEVDSRATASVTTFAVSVNVVVTRGLTVPGDGGGAVYIKGLSSDVGAFQDAGAQYWKFASVGGAAAIVDSRVTAAASKFAANINAIVTCGLATAGDGLGGIYIRGISSSYGVFQDASGQYWALTTTASGTGGGSSTPGGRITLTSNVAVPTTDVVGATTVYYTPANGNQVPIYDGTNMISTSFSQLSQATTDTTKSPAAVGASLIYDLFVWNDSGTVRCTRGPAWTNDTTRSAGTALVMVNGTYLNNASITNGPAAQRGTFVGSIRSNASSTIDLKFGSPAAGGGAAWFGVWNNYNRVVAEVRVQDSSAAWTIAAGPASLNASTNNRISILHGLDEDAVNARLLVRGISIAGQSIQFGFGLDSTSSFAANSSQSWSFGVSDAMHTGAFNGFIGLGFHYLQGIETASAGAQTARQVIYGSTTATVWW